MIFRNVLTFSHSHSIFKSLSILPLSNTIPMALSNIWPTAIEHRHNTGQVHVFYDLRNNDDYYVPPVRLAYTNRFPLYNLPSLWNNLERSLKGIPSKNSFAFKLKASIINLLSNQPNCTLGCTRLICPAGQST
jgi:hypothetical protein